MPKNVKCRNCLNLTHNWCDKMIDSPDEDMMRDCQYFYHKTNADRIRAMSDEEMADILREFAVKPIQGSFLKRLQQSTEGE